LARASLLSLPLHRTHLVHPTLNMAEGPASCRARQAVHASTTPACHTPPPPLPACHTPHSLYPHVTRHLPFTRTPYTHVHVHVHVCTHTHARARTTPAHCAARSSHKASALRRSATHQSQRIMSLGHTPKPAHCVAWPRTKASALRRSATHQSQRITSLGHTPKPAHCAARPHTKASALRCSATH